MTQENTNTSNTPQPMQAAAPSPSRGSKEGAEPSLFTIHPANEWMQQATQAPQPHDLWLNIGFIFSGQLTCLFGNPGDGKSILATNIAVDIAKAGNQVLYIDTDLTQQAFASRYRKHGTAFNFPATLHRCQLNLASLSGQLTEQDFLLQLSAAIDATSAQVVFIDNVSTLFCLMGRKASPLSFTLHVRQLIRDKNITVIFVISSSKRGRSPLAIADLGKFRSAAPFIESIFALRRSTSYPSYHYFMQIKRTIGGRIRYGASNAAVTKLTHDADGYLHFVGQGYFPEARLLGRPVDDGTGDTDDVDTDDYYQDNDSQQQHASSQSQSAQSNNDPALEAQCKALWLREPNVRKIAQTLNIYTNDVSRYLHRPGIPDECFQYPEFQQKQELVDQGCQRQWDTNKLYINFVNPKNHKVVDFIAPNEPTEQPSNLY